MDTKRRTANTRSQHTVTIICFRTQRITHIIEQILELCSCVTTGTISDRINAVLTVAAARCADAIVRD